VTAGRILQSGEATVWRPIAYSSVSQTFWSRNTFWLSKY